MTLASRLSATILAGFLTTFLAAPAASEAATAKDPIAPALSEAPVVRVTAGDHGSTSRIAFNFQPEHGFRVERESRQVTVLFPHTAVHFAYDDVYPRRQASRVVFANTEARGNDAAFTMRFACDCDADVTLDPNGRVLVQVREKGVTPANPEPPHAQTKTPAATPPSPQPEDATSAATPADPGTLSDNTLADDFTVYSASRLPRPRPPYRDANNGALLPGADKPDATAMPADPAAATATADTPSDQPIGPPASGALAAHEVERLRKSLEWAAQRGFLNKPGDIDLADSMPPFEPPSPNIVNIPESPQAEAGTAPASSRPPQPAAPPPMDQVAERDGPDTNALPLSDVAWTCTTAAQPPIVEWPDSGRRAENFLTAIGHHQARLAELPASEAMHDMAMFYLTHGLVREALAALDSTGVPKPELRDAMLILLGRGDEAGEALLAAGPCRSDSAVWRAALLKMRGYRKLAEWAAASAGEALATFPPFARTALALELAEAALNRGNADLADTFLAMVEPAPGQTVAAQVAMLQGRKALLQGQTARSDWYFSQAMEGDAAIKRQVRIALIQDAVDNGKPVPAWAEDVTRSALFDYRGDRLLLPTVLLAADVYSAAGDYTAALNALTAATRRLPQAVNQAPVIAKAKTILTAAVGNAITDDAMALQLFTEHETFVGTDPPGRMVRAQLAERMLAVGLPSTAKRLLAPLTALPDAKPEWRLMLAEAELRSGHPEAALEMLKASATSGSGAAAALRQQALASLRRYDAAAEIAAKTALDEAAATELLWAAGDWPGTATAFRKLLADTATDQPSAATGALAIRALAAAYMAGGTDRLGAQAARAISIAQAAGFADAAAALSSPPLPGNLTLPDTITTVLDRAQQVSRLFPPMAKGS